MEERKQRERETRVTSLPFCGSLQSCGESGVLGNPLYDLMPQHMADAGQCWLSPFTKPRSHLPSTIPSPCGAMGIRVGGVWGCEGPGRVESTWSKTLGASTHRVRSASHGLQASRRFIRFADQHVGRRVAHPDTRWKRMISHWEILHHQLIHLNFFQKREQFLFISAELILCRRPAMNPPL